jgi:hypothetical protein
LDTQIAAFLFSAFTMLVSLWTRAAVAELHQKIVEREQVLRREIRDDFVPRELCKELGHHAVKNDGSD